MNLNDNRLSKKRNSKYVSTNLTIQAKYIYMVG